MCRHSVILTLQGTDTGLYVASWYGNLKIVQLLLDHGADVNQPTDVSNCLRYVIIIYNVSVPITILINTSIPSFPKHF